MATEKKTIEVDPIRFGRRLGKLYDFWVSVQGRGEYTKNPLVEDSLTLQNKTDDAALSSTSALVFLVGADENDTPYMKSTSLQVPFPPFAPRKSVIECLCCFSSGFMAMK